MRNNKAPGLDGFTVEFFKKAWPIVGGDVIFAIKSFFESGMLLKEVNGTIITLVPKNGGFLFHAAILCANVSMRSWQIGWFLVLMGLLI